jgi:hypothetical protein
MKFTDKNISQLTNQLKSFGNFPFPMGHMEMNETRINQEMTDMFAQHFLNMAPEQRPSSEEIIGSLLAFRTIFNKSELENKFNELFGNINLNEWRFSKVFNDDDDILEYFVEFVRYEGFKRLKKFIRVNYCDVIFIHSKAIYYRIQHNLRYRNNKFKKYDVTNEEEVCLLLHNAFTRKAITFTNIRYKNFIDKHKDLYNFAYDMELTKLIEKVKENPVLEQEIAMNNLEDQRLDEEELAFLAIEDFLEHDTHEIESHHGHGDQHGHEKGHHEDHESTTDHSDPHGGHGHDEHTDHKHHDGENVHKTEDTSELSGFGDEHDSHHSDDTHNDAHESPHQ